MHNWITPQQWPDLASGQTTHGQPVQARPVFRYSLLALSLWSIHAPALALQAMTEQSMRQVDGQDGLIVDTQYTRIDIDRLYWEDKAGMPDGTDAALRAYADGISITGNNLGTTYQINSGSSAAGKAGMDFKVDSRYGTIAANAFKLCNSDGSSCDNSVGSLSIQAQENTALHFITKDGLFNKNSLAQAEVSLKNVNVFLGQTASQTGPSPASKNNQLIIKDFNFNFNGSGYIYIDDTGGLVLETKDNGDGAGAFSLNRVCTLGAACSSLTQAQLNTTNSKPGLNIDFVIKGDTGTTLTTTGAKGMIRVGASGGVTNASLVVRGTNGNDTAGTAILGKAFAAGNTSLNPDGSSAALLGSTGLATRLKATFTNTGTNATTLELAHGGTNAYGLQFANFTPVQVTYGADNKENTAAGSFDSGNVYINLANTKRMALPQNSILNGEPFLTGTLTSAPDYNQLVHQKADQTAANPNSLIIAVRDAEFQAISRQTRFIASPDVAAADRPAASQGTWGLGLPIYGLNANLALYAKSFTGTPYGSSNSYTNSQRLGFALGLSTKGVNTDGSKTTAIMLIDGKKYHKTNATAGVREVYTGAAGQNEADFDPINYYIGLRNIDMLMTGYGSIGLEEGKINLNIPDFMLAASGEVAVGYLPGSKYKTIGTSLDSSDYAPINGFATNRDVLFGLRIRMNGNVDMSMSPGTDTLSGNRISFDGIIGLTGGAVQIVEPTDNSIIGLDDITGKIGFSNQIKINKADVDFNTAFTINPNRQPADVLRINNLNFYPTGGAAQRLGEMVFTGGKIISNLNIKPN